MSGVICGPQTDSYVAAGPIYIGELAPAEIRGSIMTFWQLFFSVGSFIAYWVGYAASLYVKNLGYGFPPNHFPNSF